MTLYQLKYLAMGHEELSKQAKARAVRKQSDAVRQRRADIVDYYRRHGIAVD